MTFNGDHDQQNRNLHKTIEDLFDQSLKSILLSADYDHPVKLTLDAISLAPNDPDVLCKAASIMFMVQHARGLELAQELYERLSIMEPDYSDALIRLCWLAMVNGQYDKASQYAWKLNGKHSEGNPKTLFLMARAFRLQGDKKQAQICYRQVIDTLCSGNSSFPDGAQSRLVPLAAYLGGWLDEAEEAMQRLCIAGGKKALAENQALSPSLRTQLRKLREITRGKDICICGNGPSIQAFVDQPSLFKSKDIGFMGLNNFSIVWDDTIHMIIRVKENAVAMAMAGVFSWEDLLNGQYRISRPEKLYNEVEFEFWEFLSSYTVFLERIGEQPELAMRGKLQTSVFVPEMALAT